MNLMLLPPLLPPRTLPNWVPPPPQDEILVKQLEVSLEKQVEAIRNIAAPIPVGISRDKNKNNPSAAGDLTHHHDDDDDDEDDLDADDLDGITTVRETDVFVQMES